MNVERAAKRQIGGQVADSVLLLAAGRRRGPVADDSVAAPASIARNDAAVRGATRPAEVGPRSTGTGLSPIKPRSPVAGGASRTDTSPRECTG